MNTSISSLDADQVSNPIDTSSGERLAGPSAMASNRADRIMAVCPGCQATLKVRRAYIGNDVRCKRCGHIFPIAAPADTQSKPGEYTGHEQMLDEHGRLVAEHGRLTTPHGQLQATHDQFPVENGRLTTAHNDFGEHLSAVTSDLNTIRTSSGERLAGPSAQPASQADRIMAVCPGCQATLNVRRAYIGNDVKCMHCGHIFPIAAPADTESKPVEDSGHEQPLDEHGRLTAPHGQLQATHDQFQVENGRLTTAHNEFGEQLSPVTSELNTIRTSSGERLAGPSAQPASQADRIMAVCPGCQATLNVRRAYIGNDVQCMHCGHIFPIAAPADTQSKPVEDSGHEQRLDEHGRLVAEHGRLLAAHGQLQAKHDQFQVQNGRLTTAQNELGAQLSRVTNELNAVSAELGSFTPADVRSLAEERESLRTEVQRLRDENRHLSADQSTRAELERNQAELNAAGTKLDLLTAQLEEREIDLDTARAECSRLTREQQTAADEIKKREIDLDTARAECSRLTREQQTAADEIKALQMTLAERDSALRDQSDQLAAQVESHRQALDYAKHIHGATRAELGAELGRTQAKLNAACTKLDLLTAQLKEREIELNAAGTKLDLLTGQLEEREIDLDTARAECSRLTREQQTAADEIKKREIDLDTARAECSRLTREQQTAADEIKSLQITLAERDSALRDQSDQLAAQVGSHRQALDHAKHAQGAIRAELGTELERNQAELNAAGTKLDLLTAQLKEREIELNAAGTKLDLLAAQLEEREIDLDTARAECSRLTREQQTAADEIKKREIDLDTARAECSRLTREQQTAAGEIKALQMTLAERDSALRDQGDQLGAQVESHRQALEHAEHVHGAIFAELRAELERIQAELNAAGTKLDLLTAQLKEREIELNAAGTKLDLLTAQLVERDLDLDTARAECSRLTREQQTAADQIKKREIDLDTTRAECSRLTREQQTAADQIKALQMTLAERDSALRDQSDQLAAQVESHRQALDHAKHVHGAIRAELGAELERNQAELNAACAKLDLLT